jgi:hypothetical protein
VATSIQTFGVPATFGRFFGGLVSNSAGFALGVAAGGTLRPGVRDLENLAWRTHASMPLDAVSLAAGVAQGQINRAWALDEALNTGINNERMNALIHAFDTGPGIAQAYNLWRRGIIDEAGFRRAAKREGLEQEWIDALVDARNVLISPTDLAQMRQRGFIGQQRQYDESERQGVTNERAELLFDTAGLPPGVERAREMWRRGIITEAEFKKTIVEGNEKLKYQDEEAALFWDVVSASTYAELHLRGWIDEGDMNAGGKLTGYRPEDMQRLFHARGRPATTHQAFIGVRRGGTYDGPTGAIPDWFLKAVRQSNLRNEWANILWAGRHTYPSAFVLRGLTQAGDLTQAEAHEALLFVGWEPNLAAKVSSRWAGGTGTVARDPHVVKAENQLWTTQHTSYKNGESDAAEVEATLDLLNVPQGNHARILTLWNRELELVRKQLTPTQLKKAWKGKTTNPATGVAWTLDEALARLEAMGYAPADAETFLDE